MNSLNRLLELCSATVGVDITDKCRQRETYVYGRAVFYTVAKELYPLTTLQQLGRMTNRDHASVLFALRSAKDTYGYDPAYIIIYNRVRQKVNQDPADYDMRHEKMVSSMNVVAARYITEVQNKLYDANREIKELKAKLEHNVLWEYVSQIPEDHIDDFIQNRVIPYINMTIYKSNTNRHG
jgi:hypothetical protein